MTNPLPRSVELRNIMQGGGQSSTTARWPTAKEIHIGYHRPKKSCPMWNKFFLPASAISIFLDPLFCYLPVINNDNTCYNWDQSLMWMFIVCRSFLDMFYLGDIYVFLLRLEGKNKGSSSGASSIISANHEKSFIGRLRKLLPILPRIYIALPILQIIILVGHYTDADYSQIFLITPIQYLLRAIRIYGSLKRRANIDTRIRRWLRAVLDFVPFILAAHLYGAVWYGLAFERELACWKQYVCDRGMFGKCNHTIEFLFYCPDGLTAEINLYVNKTALKESCPISTPNATAFDFGIYLYALQSDMTRSNDLPKKLLQCFWWGLRNLSSFGSNLLTSFYLREALFSVLISISGLALFLVYLNARLQASRKSFDQLRLRQQKKKEFPEMIDRMRIMCRVRLAVLKKVPRLESMDEKVLRAICEQLRTVTYSENMHIIREGEPLRMMFFITQGTALTYRTTDGEASLCASLERGDFYGEELLAWASQFASLSKLPVSKRTVLSETNVVAFCIRRTHLKSVVAEYWWYFKRDLPPSQLKRFAISSLQKAARRHLANLKQPAPA